MFSFLTSKPLILALFVSLSLNGLFGYLSYHFYGERAKALLSLEVALDANKYLEKSYEKQETACKIADSISSEFQSEKEEVDKKADDLIEQINSLDAEKAPTAVNKTATKIIPQKGLISPKLGTTNEETTVAGLDDRLPPSLVSLLSESYHNLQRQGGSDAR